jgi:hypothetical protein
MAQFGSLSALVQNYESGGNYTAQNPTSTASGAYQFTNPTWQQYAGQIGVDTSQYPTAASAPPSVQDAVFQQAVSQRGLGDWTCPGCNSPLTEYVASNDVSGLPVLEGYGSNGTTANIGTGALSGGYIAPDGSYVPAQSIPGVTPNSAAPPLVGSTSSSTAAQLGGMPGELLDQPFQFGLTTGLSNAVNSWITGAETAVGNTFKNAMQAMFGSVINWVTRGFLILVGLVILALALWRLLDPGGEKTARMLRGAPGEGLAL